MKSIFKKFWNVEVFYDENKIDLNCYGNIYLITNLINNKKYVGLSRKTNKRISGHLSSAKKGETQHLYNAMRKYGKENFKYEIIDNAIDSKDLNEKEIHYIALYKSNNREFGYNIESGGGSSKAALETRI